MTYGDAIEFLINTGNTYKAIIDLSQYADTIMANMQREVDDLKAEKRTVRKFLKSNMNDENKLSAIDALTEEDGRRQKVR